MNKPTLVIMAAGLGSRFQGSKQVTGVDSANHLIIDYSIYDAVRAGFGRVVCVIKPDSEEAFEEAIGRRIREQGIELCYAYQSIDMLPEGYSVPEGRVKPWGTAHAVLCAADMIPGDFAAINADDFYGHSAYVAAANFLSAPHDQNEHAMVGYRIENTLTENGSVSRGVCVSENGMLTQITERTKIVARPGGAAYIEEDGTEVFLPAGTLVSMNMWAFSHSLLDEIRAGFAGFLDNAIANNPMKAEYYLPSVPDRLIREGRGKVRMLTTDERWYGITYRDDLAPLKEAMDALRETEAYKGMK